MILGIDISTSITGFAVVAEGEIVFYDSVDLRKYKNLFEKAERKLNPKRADRLKTLSLFIPGSGQIIAGNAKSGINSLLLIGGLSAFYISTARQYGTISAAITVLPWLSRYHVGGSENAQDSMLKRQEKLKSQYFDELIRIVRS